VQQYIVEITLDSRSTAGVILHSLENNLSHFLRRVHPKILLTKGVSKLVFTGVKILINGYSCLLFRLKEKRRK
jgi:hypothetical protein